MSTDPARGLSLKSERLHAAALGAAALALAAGLGTRNPSWVKFGISLVLLLPPLRLLTSVFDEARARRFRIAAMGVSILAFLFLSRLIK